MDLAFVLRLVASIAWTALVYRALRRGEPRAATVAKTVLLGGLVICLQGMAGSETELAFGAAASVIGPSLGLLVIGRGETSERRGAAVPKPRARWSLHLSLERSPKGAPAS